MIFEKGDKVRLSCGDQTVDALCVLASPNGVSLAFAFEAIVDGHVGLMPVLRGVDGIYRTVATPNESWDRAGMIRWKVKMRAPQTCDHRYCYRDIHCTLCGQPFPGPGEPEFTPHVIRNDRPVPAHEVGGKLVPIERGQNEKCPTFRSRWIE